MELTITKEKVLEAASKCETAKATLKVLFPEVFKGNEIPAELANAYGFVDIGDWIKKEKDGDLVLTLPGANTEMMIDVLEAIIKFSKDTKRMIWAEGSTKLRIRK